MTKYIMHLVVGVLLATSLGWAVSNDNNQQQRGSQSFTVTKGGRLELAISGGDIRITGWEKNEVAVKTMGIDEEDLQSLKMSQNGNTVRVRFHPSGGSSDVHFDISVPSQFDLDVQTSGGDIEIAGPLAGDLRGTTSGGNIRLGDLGGSIELSTAGGDIQAGGIKGVLKLRTSGGDIRIKNVSEEADVSTSGGDITVEQAGKQLRARTSGGNVRIGDVGGDANASTSGGNVEVGSVSGSASLSTSGGDIDLKSASGTVKASSSGGDLKLGKISGTVEGSTSGGNIEAQLVSGKIGRSRLSSAGGDIKLLVPTDAKATIQARIRVQGRWRTASKEYDIVSDFKTDDYQKNEDDQEIRATVNLNGGGEVVTLETTNGNIEIRKETR